jgi:hypothetical protein
MARPYSHTLEAAFGSNPDDAISAQVWTDITPWLDVQAGVQITRGRPDEFGQIVPSQMSLTLDNSDGRFTPNRAGSPYYPNVTTGKRIRYGVLWPGNGKQLYSATTLNGTLTTPGDVSFETLSSYGWGADLAGAPTINRSTVQAFHGAASMILTWGTGSARAYRYLRGLIPGWTYTASLYVWAPTGSPNPSLSVSGGAATSTATKNAWTRLTRTFVPVSGAVPFLEVTATGVAGQICYVDAVQVEEGGSASVFEPTGGSFAWRFTGDVDEWPLSWVGGPAIKAQTLLTATDRLKKLGNIGEFRSFLDEDVLDDFPIAYYPLTEPEASVTAGDVSGHTQAPLKLQQVGSGGVVNFGIESIDPIIVSPTFYKDSETAVQFLPASFGNGMYLTAALDRPYGGGSAVGAGATIVCYPAEGNPPLTTGAAAALLSADGSFLSLEKDGGGLMQATFFDATSGATFRTASAGVMGFNAEQWAAVLEITAGGIKLRVYRNAAQQGADVAVTIASGVLPAWSRVSVGGRGKTIARFNLSHVQFYDAPLVTNVLVVQWYAGMQGRGFPAGTEDTTFRLKKLLQFRGLFGGSAAVPITVQGTDTVLIGPQEVQGSPLAAIQLVVDTEDGVFFLGGGGLAVWQKRDYRFNAVPAITLAAERLDPRQVTFRGDDFGLANDVTASRSDGATARYINAASVAVYGSRKASIQALSFSDSDLTSLAVRLANTLGTQQNRMTGVRIGLLNDPASIPAALALDIGSKIALTGLPGQAPAAAKELFIEGWTEVISEADWSMTFNTSPAEAWNVWQLGVAGRSELGSTTILGY